MRGKRKTAYIVLIITVMLCILLFVFACNDMTIDDQRVVENAQTATEDAATQGTSDVAVTTDAASADGKKSDSSAEEGSSEGAGSGGGTALENAEETQSDVDEESEGQTSDEQEDENENSGDPVHVGSLGGSSEWTVYVGADRLGNALLTAEGNLESSVFRQGVHDVWVVEAEEGDFLYYLYFEELSGYRRVHFRTETGALQVDLTESELALVVPTGSLDGEGNGGSGDAQDGCCSVCGVMLKEDASHLPQCSHYAAIPEESEASDWLSLFPGVREDLVVNSMTEEAESYSFVLNYLTQEGAENVEILLRASGGTPIPRGIGAVMYHLQTALGSKVFTVSVDLENVGSHCRATVNLIGYPSEG